MSDKYREAWALYGLSRSHAGLGGYDEALRHCMAALSIWRETGNRMAEGFGLDNLGVLYRKLGEPEEAYRQLSLAWTIRREVNDSYGEGMTLDNLAQTVELLAGLESAVPYWERSLHILKQLGAPEAEQVRARLEATRHALLPESGSDAGKS